MWIWSEDEASEDIEHVMEKASKTARALGTLLPNIKVPKANKRKVLYSTVQSIILYGAPIWSDLMKIEKYINLVKPLQRMMTLRICSACTTVSYEALTVSTGGRKKNQLRQKERASA